ncbi:MAG: hypothetical protein PHF14_05775 [Verrucomicrobiota bacterium]|nr:hypothetical protein [Verrucomicrobiota bacterium]MDD8045951.1 hypothetical protein [Verrucomicrobiota bacterium]MDI9383737.1 hypothetical protein [Verrucomicrobiota bacterium]
MSRNRYRWETCSGEDPWGAVVHATVTATAPDPDPTDPTDPTDRQPQPGDDACDAGSSAPFRTSSIYSLA